MHVSGESMRLFNNLVFWAIITSCFIFVGLFLLYLSYLCFETPLLLHPDEIESILGMGTTFLMGAAVSPFFKRHGISGKE